MSEVTIQPYSDKSVIVQGDFETYAKQMKRFQARWNPRLKAGAGWLVPLEFESAVRAHFGVEDPEDARASQRFKPAPVRRRVVREPTPEPVYEDEEEEVVTPPRVPSHVPSQSAPREPVRQSVTAPREPVRQSVTAPREPVRQSVTAPRIPVVVSDDNDDIVSLARKMKDMMQRLERLENH